MAKKNLTVNHDFLAGEMSPRMEMRDDIEGRKHGVESLINWVVTPQGTVITARGNEFVGQVSGYYGRIFSFPISLFSGFNVVVTADTVTIFNEADIDQEDDLVANGNFDEGISDWDTDTSGSGSATFSGGAVELYGGLSTSQYSLIQQELTVVAGNNHKLTIAIASGIDAMTVSIGTTAGGTDILEEIHTSDANLIIYNLASTTTSMFIECKVFGTGTKTISGVHCYDMDAGGADNVEFTSPWETAASIKSIQTKMSPKDLDLYMASNDVILQKLSYDIETLTWTFAAVSFTGAPSEWASGSYPPAITFYQGRLWLGGPADKDSTFWGSKSDDYEDFTTGSLADDAIEQTLDRHGRIHWMVGSKKLVIGTENAEHIVSSDGGVIIPGDIDATIQSTYGSYAIQPIEVGNNIIYVSADRTKLRSINYEWSADSWQSRDITYASQHITLNNKITELNWSANPNSLILCTTTAGRIIACTYEPLSQTAGFANRTSLGSILSSSILSYGGIDESWHVIDRSEGTGLLNIEKQNQIDTTKLDSYMRFESETAFSSFTALPLAGKECQVLVDGAVHDTVIPDESTGEVELQYAGNEVIIGLQISSTLVTMPVADQMNPQGTTRPMTKRWNRIFVRILNSWRPKIMGRQPPDRTAPALMDYVEPAKTESVEVSSVGHTAEGKITITQDMPLPTEIGGIFGSIEQNQV